jgi:hypothetical protein
MTIEVNGDRIVLKGRCGVEEAEPLLAALAERPDRLVVLEAERLHTALWQILIALKPRLEGTSADAFVVQHILPLVLDTKMPHAAPKTASTHRRKRST